MQEAPLTAGQTALTIGQAVEYRGTNGPNGLYVITAVVMVAGEARYNLRSIPAHVRNGRTFTGPRYRHNGTGPAMPINLDLTGRRSLCVITGMTVDTIVEVAI